MTPDPFARIPDPDPYAGTVLETSTERDARETGRQRPAADPERQGT